MIPIHWGHRLVHPVAIVLIALTPSLFMPTAQAEDKIPNMILILSDDFGYGDAGPWGGGEGRGMPTTSLDRLASEGMKFNPFY